MSNLLAELGGDAGEPLPASHSSGRRRGHHPCEVCQTVCGQCTQKGLQDHFRLAQAGIQIIVSGIQSCPGHAGLVGNALGEISGGLVELLSKLLDGAREDSQFMEEARAFTEQYVVQKAIP